MIRVEMELPVNHGVTIFHEGRSLDRPRRRTSLLLLDETGEELELVQPR